ncbi:MAG: type II toxin-antitoxin system VapB family antitoxin [Xanthomonadales bacterium]|nr:type II toxin-antitoxin system VapB family antitoxin [Xanthomonadales bacterium]
MATNSVIDPELLERAVEVSGETTKKAAVTKALQEFIARREQRRVAELFGKLEWDAAYDYKSERSRGRCLVDAKRLAAALRRTNVHELLPPTPSETTASLPGVVAEFEAAPKRSTSDPLQINFADHRAACGLLPMVAPVRPGRIALWCFAIPRTGGAGAGLSGMVVMAGDVVGPADILRWTLLSLFAALHAAVWVYALFRRKPA